MSFWKHKEPEFDEARFKRYLEDVITDIMGMIMLDLTRLTTAVNAQGAEVAAVQSKVSALEAQVSPGVDQAALDALAATVEANNDALKTAGS